MATWNAASAQGYEAVGTNPLYGTKFPRTKNDFHAALRKAYAQGELDGIDKTTKRMQNDFAHKQRTVRIEALKVIVDNYRVIGQAMRELTEAMKSEAGQL